MVEKTEISAEDINKAAKKQIDDFMSFAFKKQMLQMTIAFIMGASFTKVVNALSEGVFMPIINYLIGQTNGDWRTLSFTVIDGITMEIGHFLSAFVDFLIVAFILWLVTKTPFWTPPKEDEEKK